MCKKILPLILLFAGAFYQSVAQAPANDECTGATRSTPAPSCAFIVTAMVRRLQELFSIV